MKKLMFAAAVAACVGAASADTCAPEAIEIARVYQIQLNTYTTCGHADVSVLGTSGGQCGPGGQTTTCLIGRGKDKTVIRGYIYVCADVCDVAGYSAVLCDIRRRAFFTDNGEYELAGAFTWNILNIMGSQFQDAEANWDLSATCTYAGEDSTGSAREQLYTLKGSGYGKFNHNSNSVTGAFFDNLGGYFAGTATASYDLKTAVSTSATCACDPSSVLNCSTFADLQWATDDTVAFGTWKMKYNHNISAAYLAGKWGPVAAIQKMFK